MTYDKLTPYKINLDGPLFVTEKTMESTPSVYGRLHLPENILNGIITHHNPETGIDLHCWNVEFKYPVTIVNNKIKPDAIRQFRILVLLSPENCFLRTIGQHPQLSRQSEKSLLFISDDVTLDLDVLPNEPFKLIDIKLSNSWVNGKSRNNRLSFEENWKRLLAPSSPIIVYQVLDDKSTININELFNILLSGKGGTTGTVPIIISIISDFLNKAPAHLFIEDHEAPDLTSEPLTQVLTILKSNLKNDLPKLETIARMVAISESTLKRQFKQAFGQTIYGYYLDMKMELAYTMLLERKLTVNQIALTLGYQNVSNFIDAFKKKYNISPGSMKKKES